MRPLSDCRLYAFVDTGYLRGRDPVDLARRLVEGGADLIQFRAKDWPADAVARTTAQLLPVCEEAGIQLVLNDHPDIAAKLGAPLAHLGQEDFFDAGHTRVADFLERLPRPSNSSATPSSSRGESLRLGLSSHAPDQAERAVAAGAAYVAIGPVFATPTKPGRPGVTLDYVRWATLHLTTVPWFAIGGITLANLDAVLEAGATRICVVSAILADQDVTRACRDFRRRLEP